MGATDPIALAQALIRCPSVTPEDAGAIDVLARALEPLGFQCHRLRFEERGHPPTQNLYARIGNQGPNFCFAGHTDVVPPGERALWNADPFAAEIKDGVLFGRGATDMKSAIAAFVAAAERHLGERAPKGSISLLITGDEEGTAVNGTPKLLAWLKERGERIDHCVVGEPTAAAKPGDTLKIGRRGSMNVKVTVRGVQGHVAYPARAINPIPAMAGFIARLAVHKLDDGTAHFEPSTLAFTSVDTGNPASNVIPAELRAAFNIRFNDSHTPQGLIRLVEREADHAGKTFGCEIAIEPSVGGVPFVTKPGPFTELLAKAIARVNGAAPELSTTGGTSDARFIKNVCPVVEVGLSGTTMHKIDECVPVKDIETLAGIYAAILAEYFAHPPS